MRVSFFRRPFRHAQLPTRLSRRQPCRHAQTFRPLAGVGLLQPQRQTLLVHRHPRRCGFVRFVGRRSAKSGRIPRRHRPLDNGGKTPRHAFGLPRTPAGHAAAGRPVLRLAVAGAGRNARNRQTAPVRTASGGLPASAKQYGNGGLETARHHQAGRRLPRPDCPAAAADPPRRGLNRPAVRTKTRLRPRRPHTERSAQTFRTGLLSRLVSLSEPRGEPQTARTTAKAFARQFRAGRAVRQTARPRRLRHARQRDVRHQPALPAGGTVARQPAGSDRAAGAGCGCAFRIGMPRMRIRTEAV